MVALIFLGVLNVIICYLVADSALNNKFDWKFHGMGIAIMLFWDVVCLFLILSTLPDKYMTKEAFESIPRPHGNLRDEH